MASVRKCVFNCSYNDKVMLFNEQKLKKCREVLEVRIAHNMKYNDIILPENVTEVDGYHSICCKNFLAVQSVYIQKFKEQQKSNLSSSSGASTFASTAGKLIMIF